MSIEAVRRCRECGLDLPRSMFYRAGRYLSSYCVDCSRLRRAEAPEDRKVRERQRASDWKLARRWGLTRSEYVGLRELQGNRCAICGSSQDLALDHDHQTGLRRLFLCGLCNRAIGSLRDDPELAERAASYLRNFRREALA